MFNGIIKNTGIVKKIRKIKKYVSYNQSKIKINKKMLGSSISCNGVCLTLNHLKKN